MGMNGKGESHDGVDDLMAAYALDAVDDADALVIEAHLASSSRASSTEQLLRSAGSAYAAAVLPDITLPGGLRDRVIAASFARRAGVPLTPSTAVELHRLETERALLLFDRITGDQWSRTVDPEELTGWTVRDLVAHVHSNETLLALELGIEAPRAPEAQRDNVPRTEATAARFADRDPKELVDEYRAFVRAVDEHVSGMDDAALEQDIAWWGTAMRASTALIVRTFETWTHADDIRRALGRPHVAPSAPDLAAMSERSLEWAPLMMLSTAPEIEPAIAALVLTGPGGGRHLIELGVAPAPSGAEPRFELTVDVVDYCRAIANRFPEAGLAHTVTGDVELASAFVRAIPSLAGV